MRRGLLALAALFLGCGSNAEPLPPRRIELADLAPRAKWLRETVALDIGEPAAREAMWSGWGPDERNASDSFVWGGGDGSRLRLVIVERRDRTLRLRGWAYPFADGAGVEIRFVLNGRALDKRLLPPTATTLTLELPSDRLEIGENFLELQYARHHEVPGAPPWAAAWDAVRVEGGASETPAPSSVEPGAGGLAIGAGVAIEWTGELPAGAFLAWERVELDEDVRLWIAGREGHEDVANGWIAAAPGQLRINGPASSGAHPRLTRIQIAAIGKRGEVHLEGLRLHLPEANSTALAPAAKPPAGPPARPNLIVYLIDTLRADRLGCYGSARPTSPRIDAFAREAMLFREGRAQTSWTRPAIATLLSGLPPWVHGVEERSSALPQEVETLAERLRAAGYETALFTTNANIVPRFGFDQGWDSFQYLYEPAGRVKRHVASRVIHNAVVRWLDGRDPAKPFLLFVHTLDPHDPYRPAEEFRLRLAPEVDVESACCGGVTMLDRLFVENPEAARRRAAAALLLYDAEVAENDASFGALLDELERRGLAASSSVLLTSDHGEEFLEHGGWKHGTTLYEEMLRVPFVLRLPGGVGAGRIVDSSAEQIDLVPTFLALAGVPADPALPGRNLSRAANDDGPRLSSARLVRSGVYLSAVKHGPWKLVRASGAWIAPLGRAPFTLRDLASDADESLDLSFAHPLERAWLEGEMRHEIASPPGRAAAPSAEIDDELDQSLRALGYI